MTLTEARKILEQQLAWCRSSVDDPEPPRPNSDDFYEAMETAIRVLPKESTRRSVSEEFGYITEAIASAKDGFRPFGSRSRNKVFVCWRQCVWKMMKRRGYPTTAMARIGGYDHATVWWGLIRLDNYLEAGDSLAISTWQELNDIMNNGRTNY